MSSPCQLLCPSAHRRDLHEWFKAEDRSPPWWPWSLVGIACQPQCLPLGALPPLVSLGYRERSSLGVRRGKGETTLKHCKPFTTWQLWGRGGWSVSHTRYPQETFPALGGKARQHHSFWIQIKVSSPAVLFSVTKLNLAVRSRDKNFKCLKYDDLKLFPQQCFHAPA